jgi:hypothetical protein
MDRQRARPALLLQHRNNNRYEACIPLIDPFFYHKQLIPCWSLMSDSLYQRGCRSEGGRAEDTLTIARGIRDRTRNTEPEFRAYMQDSEMTN